MRPELAASLLDSTRAATLSALGHSIATCLCRPTVVLARVWLMDDEALQLTGSAGFPAGGGSYARLDGTFGRIASRHEPPGHITLSRTPLLVRSIRGDESWLANPGWIARQGVRSFLRFPLIAQDEVLGVLAVFDRSAPNEATLAEVRFVADFAAARVHDLQTRAALEPQESTRPPAPPGVPEPATLAPPPAAPTIVTRAELRALERQTIEAALTETRGRVFGPHGAAALLAMKPTTLASRIKALGIRSMR